MGDCIKQSVSVEPSYLVYNCKIKVRVYPQTDSSGRRRSGKRDMDTFSPSVPNESCRTVVSTSEDNSLEGPKKGKCTNTQIRGLERLTLCL